ncbi:hypothetical protein WDZ92_42360, partial [Nostoc sp. NIES-2111]
ALTPRMGGGPASRSSLDGDPGLPGIGRRMEAEVMQDGEAALRTFPQVAIHERMPSKLLKFLYGKATNSEIAFRMANRDYVRAFNSIARPPLDEAARRIVAELRVHGIAFATFEEFFPKEMFDRIAERFETMREDFVRAEAVREQKALGTKKTYLDTIYKAHTFVPGDVISDYLGAPIFAAIAAEYMQLIPRYVGSSFWHTRPAPSASRDRRETLSVMRVLHFLSLRDCSRVMSAGLHKWREASGVMLRWFRQASKWNDATTRL